MRVVETVESWDDELGFMSWLLLVSGGLSFCGPCKALEGGSTPSCVGFIVLSSRGGLQAILSGLRV